MEVRDQVRCGYALDAEAFRRRCVRGLFCLAWVFWAGDVGVPGFLKGPWAAQGCSRISQGGILGDIGMAPDLPLV